MKKTVTLLFLSIIILVSSAFFLYQKYENEFNKNSISKSSEKLPSPKESVFGKLNDDDSKWKIFKIKDMTVKYPFDWPTVDQSEIINTPNGFGVQITNSDDTTRIIVLTDLNSNKSEKELNNFLESLISLGAKSIIVDGNKASQSKVTHYAGDENHKIITSYINAPDKKNQYSLTIESNSGITDKELEKLFESIISRVRFK